MDGLKQNYRVRSRLEVFYTGGSVRLSNDGTTLACACADEVKVGVEGSDHPESGTALYACVLCWEIFGYAWQPG